MKGQTLIEYILIIGVVIAATYAIGPAFRRGIQTVVRSAADQVAVQKDADQDFGYNSGYMASSKMNTDFAAQRSVRESSYYTTNTLVNEATTMHINTVTNMGFHAE